MYTKEILEPYVDFDLLDPSKRKEGLSGFMRLRNEA